MFFQKQRKRVKESWTEPNQPVMKHCKWQIKFKTMDKYKTLFKDVFYIYLALYV